MAKGSKRKIFTEISALDSIYLKLEKSYKMRANRLHSKTVAGQFTYYLTQNISNY